MHRIGVDIGGTFTDCVVVDDAGRRTVSKALTTHQALSDGVIEAVKVNAELRGRSMRALLADTSQFVHGTTVATNAVLTRTGAKTGLLTTRGHEDAIIIGKVFAKRAGLGERDIVHASRLNKPEPIVPRALIRGLPERIDARGAVVAELDEDAARLAIRELLEAGIEAIAVSLLWSFVNDLHERRLQELIAAEAPDLFSSFSFELAPVLGEYERTSTTVLNAYVGPKVAGYLGRLEARLREEGLDQPLLVIQSSGGLTSVAEAERSPILTLDSGPTGGILGCQYVGSLYRERHVIGADVGGTSFDIGLVLDGELPLEQEPVVQQYTLRIPKVEVKSIGAGGGSIAWIDQGGLLRVGPQSAGSRPGPACYGRGGTRATVTDANLVLGYLDPESFLGGRMELDSDLAHRALDRLGERLGMSAEQVAVGVFQIANASMADLIRRATIERGIDPREAIVVAYGGAGPTHAAFFGRDLSAKAIVVLPNSTAFSAEGMLTSDIVHTAQASMLLRSPLGDAEMRRCEELLARLEERVREQFRGERFSPEDLSIARQVDVRFMQQVHTLSVDVPGGPLGEADGERIRAAFVERYRGTYGRGAALEGGQLEVELHRVVGRAAIEPLTFAVHAESGGDGGATPLGTRQAWFEPDGSTDVPVYEGDALKPGDRVAGPAIIESMGHTVVLPADFEAHVDRYLSLQLRPLGSPPLELGEDLSEVAIG